MLSVALDITFTITSFKIVDFIWSLHKRLKRTQMKVHLDTAAPRQKDCPRRVIIV